MRGSDGRSGALFSYVDLEDRVPAGHPLRTIRAIVNQALGALSSDFDRLYGRFGRPGVPPEKLLRALLLQALYSIRSERQLMERLDFDLLFRWFVGLGIDDPVWDHSTFSKNRDRLLAGDVAARFMAEVLNQPKVRRLLSDDHFTVDGTLIEAWASMKSFQPRDGDDAGGAGGGRNPEADFRGQRRRNDTHASITDSDARLFRKGNGQESRLAYLGHLLSENRHGLVVRATTTRAGGRAEWEAGLAMVGDLDGRHRITVGGDKGYDVKDFASGLRALGATPHVARQDYVTKTGRRRRSSVDRRTTRHPGYLVSQRRRKLIEEAFGWIKTIAGQAKTRFRGLERVGWSFQLAAAAYNLIRLPKLLAAAP
ncbi:MAG TPA: IS5 family transposase [Geminicoccaceae bacterium]